MNTVRSFSLAVTSVDRTEDYYAKPAHRQRPDFRRQYLKGQALQEEMRRRWAADKTVSDPDGYMEESL